MHSHLSYGLDKSIPLKHFATYNPISEFAIRFLYIVSYIVSYIESIVSIDPLHNTKYI